MAQTNVFCMPDNARNCQNFVQFTRWLQFFSDSPSVSNPRSEKMMIKQARYLSLLGVGLSASAVVGWLLLKENRRERDPGTVTIRSQHGRINEELTEIVLPLEDFVDEVSPESFDGEDDLTQIHDIGPRFSEALKQVGIVSFAQLAQQNAEDLSAKLAEYVAVRPQRITDNNWIGQAAELASTKNS